MHMYLHCYLYFSFAVLVGVRTVLVTASRLGAVGPGADRPDSTLGEQAPPEYGPRYYS